METHKYTKTGMEKTFMDAGQKKSELIKPAIEGNLDILRCPLCKSRFAIAGGTLICREKHSFDISRKGCVNLFGRPTKITEIYDNHLFTARKSVSDSGLYAPLCGCIADYINSRFTAPKVLDAGCGCGNVTKSIADRITPDILFGVDLSKYGISRAASDFFDPGIVWLVGNINNLPFADGGIDVILNVMSPANYAEFKRVTGSGGVIIKVLIGADYLAELRRFIYGGGDKNEYSNAEVFANLSENLGVEERIDLRYTHTLCGENVLNLFDMTPLTSKTPHDVRERLAAECPSLTVTLDFKIIVSAG